MFRNFLDLTHSIEMSICIYIYLGLFYFVDLGINEERINYLKYFLDLFKSFRIVLN